MAKNKILVSVISEHTIPNLLLIKEYSNKDLQQLFISTIDMENQGRSLWIERVAKFEDNSVQRIIVDPNNNKLITAKLKEELPDFEQNNYIVNLTCGTKPMTLAIFDFFKEPNNKIVYIPIGKNLIEELYPNLSDTEAIIKYRLNLKEYLHGYGLYFQSNNNLLHNENETFNFFYRFKNKKFSFHRENRILYSHQEDTAIDRTYYSGRWFEEYVYLKIKKELKLSEEDISIEVKIYRDPQSPQNDNEFDVMFTKDNSLYVVECKASIGSKTTIKDKMDDYLYKLGAITKDFGLRTNSYIFTLTNLKNIAGKKYENLEKKINILGIKRTIDANDFLQEDFSFINFFK